MTGRSIGLFQAKTQLSVLVTRAKNRKEAVIAQHHRAVAKLVPLSYSDRRNGAGRLNVIAALLAFEPVGMFSALLQSSIEVERA